MEMSGPEEIRTLDLRYAKATLYQLSYRPICVYERLPSLLHIAHSTSCPEYKKELDETRYEDYEDIRKPVEGLKMLISIYS